METQIKRIVKLEKDLVTVTKILADEMKRNQKSDEKLVKVIQAQSKVNKELFDRTVRLSELVKRIAEVAC